MMSYNQFFNARVFNIIFQQCQKFSGTGIGEGAQVQGQATEQKGAITILLKGYIVDKVVIESCGDN
jgi:hypothetical protein